MFCIVAGIVRLEPARQPVFLDRNFLTQGPGQTAIKQNKGKRKGRERERVCWEISVESQDISYNGKEVTRDC